MRSVLLPASLVAALWLAVPGPALGQPPEAAPPPAENPRTPPPREYAVPRTAAPRSETIVVREPQSDTGSAPRDNSSADQGNRRRPPAAASAPAPAPAPSSATSSGSSDQGAQRRGTVRRPPSDRNAGRGQVTRDRAVGRSSVPPRNRDRDTIYVYPDYWSYGRYYDPYYSRGFHLGYLAYSPWGWMPAFYGYPYGAGYGGGYGGYGGGYGGYQSRGYDLGSLKIKVKPRDAEVYVDGYFAGHVDDFDGFWQSLKLDGGGYRVEIRKPGFETLQFDVHVQPDRTITYRGELRPSP